MYEGTNKDLLDQRIMKIGAETTGHVIVSSATEFTQEGDSGALVVASKSGLENACIVEGTPATEFAQRGDSGALVTSISAANTHSAYGMVSIHPTICTSKPPYTRLDANYGLKLSPVHTCVKADVDIHHDDEPQNLAATTKQGSNQEIWEKRSFVGGGASGRCYQWIKRGSSETRVVKEIETIGQVKTTQELVKMAKNEIEINLPLKNKNLVHFFGSEVEGSVYKLQFEFMEGGTVHDRLEATKEPFPEYDIRRYLRQMTRGLQYLYEQRIIHRDMTARNVMFDVLEETLKIGDFGIATKLSGEKTQDGEFQGEFVGTVPYMSPQRITEAHYGRLEDVWGMGCIGKMMSKGATQLWNCPDEIQCLIFKIGNLLYNLGNFTADLPDTLNEDVKDFILKCLTIDANKRPTPAKLLRHPAIAESVNNPAYTFQSSTYEDSTEVLDQDQDVTGGRSRQEDSVKFSVESSESHTDNIATYLPPQPQEQHDVDMIRSNNSNVIPSDDTRCQTCGSDSTVSFKLTCKYRQQETNLICGNWAHQECNGIYYRDAASVERIPYYCHQHAPPKVTF